jgi:hypothetical protein
MDIEILFQAINRILPLLTFIALVLYAYFTYIIAKDINEPFVSFNFTKQPNNYYLNFYIINKSKVEVEAFGKLKSKIDGKLFEIKEGFYGNKSSWILQPFIEGKGNVDLSKLINKEGSRLYDEKKFKPLAKSIEFSFQIRYKKIGAKLKRWKKSSLYTYVCNFETNIFYPKV